MKIYFSYLKNKRFPHLPFNFVLQMSIGGNILGFNIAPVFHTLQKTDQGSSG
jgi:hypothetical protein